LEFIFRFKKIVLHLETIDSSVRRDLEWLSNANLDPDVAVEVSVPGVFAPIVKDLLAKCGKFSVTEFDRKVINLLNVII